MTFRDFRSIRSGLESSVEHQVLPSCAGRSIKALKRPVVLASGAWMALEPHHSSASATLSNLPHPPSPGPAVFVSACQQVKRAGLLPVRIQPKPYRDDTPVRSVA